MLRKRIRSALYIDFENVPLPPEAIGNWLAWLEDGLFDASGKHRRFLQKRVYWNSHAERNRELFQRHGFVAILVGKYSGLKNGADIRMAMDVVETTYTRSDIDEFILLTGDSDFVPVIERLKQKSKRTAIVATEHRPNIHTTYHRNADFLIPSRRLTDAAQYKRGRPGLLARLLGREAAIEAPPGRIPTTGTAHPAAMRQNSSRKTQTPAEREPADPPPILETAARRVIRLLTQQPRNYVSQKRVLAELDRVQSFKRQGPTAYFGIGSYKALMQELSRLDARITVVDQPGGGTGVVHIPPSPPGVTPQSVMMPSTTELEAVPPPAADDTPLLSAAANGIQHEPPGSVPGTLVATRPEAADAEPTPVVDTALKERDVQDPAEPTPEDQLPTNRLLWITAHESPPERG